MAGMFEKLFSGLDYKEKQNKEHLDEMDELSFQLREMRYLNVTNKEQLDKGIDLIRKTIVDLQSEQVELKGVLQSGIDNMQDEVQVFLRARMEEIDEKLQEAVAFLKRLEEMEKEFQEEQQEKFRIFREEVASTLAEDKDKRDAFMAEVKASQEQMLADDREEQRNIIKGLEKTVNQEQGRRLEELEAKLEKCEYERKRQFKITRNYFKAGIWILLINLMFLIMSIVGLFA